MPGPKPQRSRKIFGIGLSRTGTTTLASVMERHGFKTTHFAHSLIARGSWTDVDAADFVCDAPIPQRYQECDRRYEGSQFILTTRSKSSWLASMRSHLKHGRFIWQWDVATERYHHEFFGTAVFNEELLANSFDEFHAGVEEYFRDRPSDLHTVNIEHGFDITSLCRFVGVDPVTTDVPHMNGRRRATIAERIRYYLRRPL